uniref:Ig-like domain-containing protein n=1 Tax=Ascaris lumbricoides TaxID=6252 RepID=A0A9J2P8G8_ASCLU
MFQPLQDKRVIVGQKVALECQVEGHPEPVVKWLKDGQNVTQCPDYEISGNGVKHRLLIPNVQAPDSGRFTIQAMNAAGVKQSSCTLIVAPAPTPIPGVKSIAESPAPPQTPVGPSAPLFLKELKHQPLKPGAQVVLEARVVGNPPPQVEWLKNGSPLKNYRAKTEYNPHTGICLSTIPQMFTDDIDERTCKANDTNGVGESCAHVSYSSIFYAATQFAARDVQHCFTVFEQWAAGCYYLATSITDGSTMSNRKSQKRGRIRCSLNRNKLNKCDYFEFYIAKVYRPSRTIFGTKVVVNLYTYDKGAGRASITSLSQRRQGARYSAIAPPRQQQQRYKPMAAPMWQWLLSESETESELVAALDTRGIGTAPIIRSPLRGLRLTEGTDAILQCNIVGSPKPRIEWRKDGITMSPTGPPRITMTYRGSLAVLKISMVLPEDTGEYTVLAENNLGRVILTDSFKHMVLNV